MAYQIFISYRRNGGEALAYLLNEKLSNAGCDCGVAAGST